jgi:hypothetical protein
MSTRKRLVFFLTAYLSLSIVMLVLFIVPALNDKNDLRLWADSVHYMDLAKTKILDGDNANISFFSIPTILLFFGNDLFAIFAFNTLVFLAGYFSLCRCFNFNKEKFLFWVLINPMFVFAWLTPSKEILAFSGVMMLNCFIKSRQYLYLIFCGFFCIFARGQLFATLVLFLFLKSKFYFFNKKRKITLIIFIFLLSGLYPFFSEKILDEETKFALNHYFDTSVGSGTVIILYELQTRGLFFITLIPKLFLNLFGNIHKIQDCFIIPVDLNGKIDVYGSWATVGHEMCLLMLMLISIFKKKFKFDLSNDLTYYVCINMIFFAITPFIQPRYMFPVYATFALQHAMTENLAFLNYRMKTGNLKIQEIEQS